MDLKKCLNIPCWFLLFVCANFGCNEELSLDSPNTTPGYFVECYMRPNELYNLTATEVQPIFEEYILDYSHDFDVYIIHEDTTELLRSLFVEPETGFIYNYGSPHSLDINQEIVRLFVITPDLDTLTSSTRIPEQVKIESVGMINGQIKSTFYSSVLLDQNYYISIVNFFIEDGEGILVPQYDIRYLELGNTEEPQLQEVLFNNELFLGGQDFKLTLMRVTEENYTYQVSLEDAKSAGSDNITFPSPLAGNINNGIGIFTAYTEDVVEF